MNEANEQPRTVLQRVFSTWLLVPAACIALFLLGIAFLAPFYGAKDSAELLFKGIAGLIALSGAAIALQKYFDELEKANEAALAEARKPYETKRQEVYYQLVAETGNIGINERSDPSRLKSEREFWRLHWGAVPMVADDEVAVAVDDFADTLAFRPDNAVELMNRSMDLARACRRSLGFSKHTPDQPASVQEQPKLAPQ